MYTIISNAEYGRGLYATRQIYAGELIAVCELLVLSPVDTITLNRGTALEHYTFKFNDAQDCLVLGDGELFNHSFNPNVKYSLKPNRTRHVMVFQATRDIQPDEQLFIDYTSDSSIDINKYLSSKSLTGDQILTSRD